MPMKPGVPLLYTIIPIMAAGLFFFAGALLFSGCYAIKQGSIMLGYLGRAVPLESLVPGDARDEDETQEFVERIRDIRRFAVETLGLRDTANYTKYVALDRDYLASIVSASASDAFIRYEWWFPVIGRVPYKGFFQEKDARKEALKLRDQGLDVWVRQVDAFSTLGWFRDPLYSFMRSYSAYHLADLIIHETLHATVFLKNQVQFNEELAEFVGTQGARLYIEQRFGRDSPEYERILEGEVDSAAYLAYIQALIAELDVLYQQDLDREEKLRQKEAIIRSSQERFTENYDALFRGNGYRGFARLPVNNAYLELFRLYHEGGGYLEELYERSGQDLPRFIAAAKTLPRKTGDPRRQLAHALGQY